MTSRGGLRLHVLATVACATVLLAACAGMRPAPVLPIDPIYEPDNTPTPSDAPLIESSPLGALTPPGASARPPASSSSGKSASITSNDTSTASVGASTDLAVAEQATGTSGTDAAGATGTGVAGAAGTETAGGASNAPERVALAPSALPSPLPAGASGTGASTNGATTGNAAVESSEDLQLVKLLADLQRYGKLTGEELRRELAFANTAYARQHTDANRIRVGVLYSLVRTSSQDDQRALQMFEAVATDAPPMSPMRHLAAILEAQVLERQRAVKYEQQKGDAAIQKLEALRAMEQSLFRDRVRGGGGGGAGGGGGSGR